MLYEFITSNRDWLLNRCKQYRAARTRAGTDERTDQGISLFLDQLAESLRLELAGQEQHSSEHISGNNLGIPSQFTVGSVAAVQGRAMQELGFTVSDVVHSYGDICQAIVERALQQALSIGVAEYRLLNRCLDNAIASAVAEFSYQRDASAASHRDSAENQRLATLGNELRNQLGTATLAVAALKARELPLGGTTGTILERSLLSLGRLVDDMLRAAEQQETTDDLLDLFPLHAFMQQLKETVDMSGAAQSRRLVLSAVDPTLAVKGLREALEAAVIGLLQAAIQATQAGNEVAMHAYASGAYIRIDIACPGVDALPAPQQLSLAMASRMVAGMHGSITVHSGNQLPLTLSISLPRWSMPT
ncbi:sensor histidine kinase [Pseudoduganella sp.]|uniref:sensor histidine kinase n=1 Tax=Pseudoduganella sp. TaxID=1880898 RepID=UPI0035B3A96B